MKNIMIAVMVGLALMFEGLAVEVLAGRMLVISLSQHRWCAMEDGRAMRCGRVSGGRNYCPDIRRSCRTPTGSFRIISKGSVHCRSTRYPRPHGGAPMQYCMFFTRLYAIHGSNDVPRHHASHGCIRVTPSDAQWLSHHFVTIGMPVTVRW